MEIAIFSALLKKRDGRRTVKNLPNPLKNIFT